MATIRLRDWTKARLDEIQAAEAHSSHDSVVKSLLKDRELAALATEVGAASAPAPAPVSVDDGPSGPPAGESAVEDMTVFAELRSAERGVLFCWCPGCGNEVAHLVVDNPVGITVFEVECQRCLAPLDQHALVGIEIGYPLEQRLVEGAVADDLRRCVVDYWDRSLRGLDETAGVEVERLVRAFGRYLETFSWSWPAAVPAVALEPGRTYRDESTGEHLAVVERVADGPAAPEAFRVRRFDPGRGPTDATRTERLTASAVADRLRRGELWLVDGADPVDEPDPDDGTAGAAGS